VLKSNTDKVGLVADTKTRIKKAHKYLADTVNEAHTITPLDYPLAELLLRDYSSQHHQFQQRLVAI